MTEAQTKPAAAAAAAGVGKKKSALQARIDKVKAAILAAYQHFRHDFAHRRVLSHLPPSYRTALQHVSDSINSACSNAGVQVVPEDLCVAAAVSMIVPLSYFTARRTHVFHVTIESYFAFVYPVMVSFYDAESGDGESTSADLAAWVFVSLITFLERMVLGWRGYERLWYLALKCGLVYGLFSPRIDGSRLLLKRVVRPHVLPALELGGGEFAKKNIEKEKEEEEEEEETFVAANVKEPSKTNDATTTAADVTTTAAASAASPTEEDADLDASTQDSKESGYSFVDVSELDQEKEKEKQLESEPQPQLESEPQPQPEPETVHLTIDNIIGTDWMLTDGKEMEGPYLVFDVIDKPIGGGEVAEFMPPSTADASTGKKYRTPVGAPVEDDEDEDVNEEGDAGEEEAKADETKVEEDKAGKEATVPELTEEDEKEEKPKEKAEDKTKAEETEKKGEMEGEKDETEETEKDEKEAEEVEGKEEATEKDEETPKKEEAKEEPTAVEADTEKKEEKEVAASAPEKVESEEDDKEEETPPAASEPTVDKPKAKVEKQPKTMSSFTWPDTSLAVPVVLFPPSAAPPSKKDGAPLTSKEEKLLRVVAYDRRTIGSDAFFGAAYVPAPTSASKEAKTEKLTLRDGRKEEGKGGDVGEISMSVRCS